MSRYLIDKHKDVPEIERIEKMDLNSQERKNAITLLTLKGDFLYNCAVMLEQRGVLFVLRRPDANNPTEPEDYIPCIYCLGFVQNTQVYKHAKKCHFKITGFGTDSNRIVRQGKSLLYKMINPDDGSNDEWQEIKTKIRQDDVGKYILNDDTLCDWGRSLTIKLGSQQGKYIRDRLRTVATFCTKYRQEHGTENTSLSMKCRRISMRHTPQI